MKKIILSLFLLLSIFTIAGCEDNNQKEKSDKTSRDTRKEEKFEHEPISNSFTCQGKISLMTNFALRNEPVTNGEDKSEDMENWSIGFPGKYVNEDIENAKLTFIYDKNNKLSSIQGKEFYNKKISSQVTEEQIKEMTDESYDKNGDTFKFYLKNNQLIMEYTIGSNNDFIKYLIISTQQNLN